MTFYRIMIAAYWKIRNGTLWCRNNQYPAVVANFTTLVANLKWPIWVEYHHYYVFPKLERTFISRYRFLSRNSKQIANNIGNICHQGRWMCQLTYRTTLKRTNLLKIMKAHFKRTGKCAGHRCYNTKCNSIENKAQFYCKSWNRNCAVICVSRFQ